MPRLYIPEPDITLYKDGFEGHDKLGRKETGDKLSELVERIDDPLVIALDGAWGSGKSVFLKCWVGEHLKRNGNTTQTVYFDAFKHDYLDDPLIALTGEILGRKDHPNKPLSERALAQLKETAPQIKRGLLRGGVALATAGVVQHGDELVDGVAKAVGKDLTKATDKFWAEESGRRQAMEAFRDALTELTEPATADQEHENDDIIEGDPTRKLIVVVDELDRCRPDYALSLLEIIKHFFAVEGVHFVLGVNLRELQNSVRARYGSDTNAAKYLQKFFSIEMPLKSGAGISLGPANYTRHFSTMASQTGASSNPLYQTVYDYLQMANHHFEITLRDVEKIAVLMALLPQQPPEIPGEKILLAGCIILKIVAPNIFERARKGVVTFEELDHAFLLQDRQPSEQKYYEIKIAWMFAAKHSAGQSLSDQARQISEKLFAGNYGREILRLVIANWLDGFEVNDL